MSRLTFCSLVLSLAASACGGTTTTPTTPDPDPIVDTYQGNLNVNGGERHSFVTARAGDTIAVLTGLTPTDAVVGIGLGSFNSSTGICQVLLANDKATLGTRLTGRSDRAGNLCVRVFDAGDLTGPVNYVIQVQHF